MNLHNAIQLARARRYLARRKGATMMHGADYRQQQELEEERQALLSAILEKAARAQRDGYFTLNDLRDMQREFGLTNLRGHDDERNATNTTSHQQEL